MAGGWDVHTNLYVCGLPDGVFDDSNFRELFLEYGTILSTKCVLGKYGFVKFSAPEEAAACIEALNGADVNGSTILVKYADNDKGQGGKASKDSAMGKAPYKGPPQAGGGAPYGKGHSSPGSAAPFGKGQSSGCAALSNDNLYIKGLPVDMTEEKLSQIFGAYGTIVSLKVMMYEDGSIAMIRMADPDIALWCVQNLDNNIPEGLADPVTVRFANEKGGGKGSKASAPAIGKGSYGGYNATPQPSYGKAALGNGSQSFKGSSPYGGLDGFAQPPGGQDPDIHAAVQCVLGAMTMQKPMTVEGDPSNLYVKDLPGTADDLYLYKVFAPFGAVQSVFVKPGNDGTWSVGFVKFAKPQDAAKAIRGVNGLQLPDGSSLSVQVKSVSKLGAAMAPQMPVHGQPEQQDPQAQEPGGCGWGWR